ncbi:MAG: MATE family efflux transporter [Cyanobacteria bacterium M5B4]|nr:MAG: MATE family efflux transporter [Cyanobacteria bacterium M5B4]
MMVPLAGLVDTAFLGHLADLNQLAGVILGGILFDYLYRILKFLRSSTIALTASAPEGEALLTVLLRSLMVALTIGFSILLLQYPICNLGFALIAGSPDLEASGVNYFNGRVWGAPAVLGNFVLIGWFLGQEKTAVVLLMSLVGNGVNIILDYLMINPWGSGGAGLATAISQYCAFFVGVIIAIKTIGWFPGVLNSLLTEVGFKQTITLKANVLIRFLVLISVFAIFTNLSARLGSNFLTENGLLLQIALLSQFTIQGIGMTTQTLVGRLYKEGEAQQMLPLIQISIIFSTTIALLIGLITVAFPKFVFSLLTNHLEIQTAMESYDFWLLPLLIFTAVAFMLEGYFIGLKEGTILRNSSIYSFLWGFLPLAGLGVYYQNNHLLWAALTLYMLSLAISLALQLPQTQRLVSANFSETAP